MLTDLENNNYYNSHLTPKIFFNFEQDVNILI